MTQIRSRSSTRRWLGSWLGVLAGLWGVTVIVIFGISQAYMIEAGTPWEIAWVIEGPAFVVLGLHLLGYVACSAMALLAGIDRVRNINWLRLMLSLSLAFLGLSVIPFSTIGPFNWPAAVGLLASSLLLLATPGESEARPAA